MQQSQFFSWHHPHYTKINCKILRFMRISSAWPLTKSVMADFCMLLAHLSRRLRGEPLVYQWPSSVRQNFQTSSPLKSLGQLNSNFIWRLLRMGEPKFVQMGLVTWPRWPPCPYMVKTFENLLLQNQKADDLGTWYVASGLWGLPSLFKWWS